jgi:hypothetical protein
MTTYLEVIQVSHGRETSLITQTSQHFCSNLTSELYTSPTATKSVLFVTTVAACPLSVAASALARITTSILVRHVTDTEIAIAILARPTHLELEECNMEATMQEGTWQAPISSW